MLRLFKSIITILSALFLLLVIAIIIAIVLVNPNNFKTQLINQVQQYTGRQLAINGNLSWTLYPVFGIKANDLSLSNAPAFPGQHIAEIKQADVSIAVKPLMQGNVQLGELILDGLSLHLMKNSQGVTNWQDMVAQTTTSTQTSQTTTATDPTNNQPHSSYFKLSSATISAIKIENSQIDWNDMQKNQKILLTNINLESHDLALNKSFPVILGMQFQNQSLPKPLPIKIQTDVMINSDANNLNLTNLIFQIANLNLNGNVDINHLTSTPNIAGDFSAPTFDLGSFLTSLGKASTLTDLNNVSGKFHLQVSSNVIALNPMQLNIYQGQMTGSAALDQNYATPHWQINTNFTNINIQPLLTNLQKKLHLQITGTGNLSAKITTEGEDSSAITENLYGNGRFSVNNGIIHGIDIPYYSNLADALANKKAPTATNTHQTPFGNMTGTYNINNGIVTNNDLKVLAPQFTASGTGTANLINQQINYTLTLQRMTGGQNSQSRGPAVPIKITGSFDNPSITPDWKSLITATVGKEISQQIQQYAPQITQTLQKGLNALFGK